ncbi:MAG: glycosyltransferase [Acidimicrobiales bacterium]
MDHERVSRRRLPRAAAVTSAVASLAYLTWRLLFTVHWAAWWLAVPFLLLEVHASLRFALTVFELWGAEEEGLPVHTTLPDLTVAVVIPTYDEGIDVLLPTVAAALALEPAHQTWVLDDGARPDVAELAHQLGAGYIARPDNQYAKAGNLNFALGYIETDLLAVLDADHVAQPEFLRKTLPYFVDPGLGLVQTPQDFYNINSFVHLDKDFHEEQFFHHAIQSGKNRYKSALWCGTGSVVRADALRSIGGVATASITEDLHTTIRLHEAGWRTTHHNEVLSRGLAPRTFDEFRLQRWRWGAGAMQAFAIDPPLRAPGLSLGQRVSYFASLASWFDSWRTLGFLLIPLIVVLTGTAPVTVALGPLVLAGVGVMIGQLLAIKALAGGRLRLWWATVFEVLRMPMNLSSTRVFLRPRALGFGVTPKGRPDVSSAPCKVPALIRVLEWSHMLVWGYGVAVLAGVAPSRPGSMQILVIALSWTLFNLLVLNSAMTRITDPRFGIDQRGAVRLSGTLNATMSGHAVELLDVSMSGARLRVPEVWRSAVREGWTLELPLSQPVELGCSIRRVDVAEDGFVELGVEFDTRQWFALADLAMAVLRSGPPPTRKKAVADVG